MIITANALQGAITAFANEKKAYFEQWMFDEPLYVSPAEDRSLRELQVVMAKVIRHFVEHYADYAALMPLSPAATKVLDCFRDRPYRIGTYRTDFVFDPTGQMRIIEITCRFALNGVFSPAIMNAVAEAYRSARKPELDVHYGHAGVAAHLIELLGDSRRIVVLKGGDDRNSSKLYSDIFTGIGCPVEHLNYAELERRVDELHNAWIISELALEEIETLSEDCLRKLAGFNVTNDFRTVFLVHDKRFFSVLGDARLRRAALTPAEIALLDRFYIPTYTGHQAPEVWARARGERERWIIKHRSLGKSQQIYAGLVTAEKDWQELIDRQDRENLVLQRWIPQRKIHGEINGEAVRDYVTGTALFFNDYYFGLAEFRTSSHPVINVVDHRKCCSLVCREDQPALYANRFAELVAG